MRWGKFATALRRELVATGGLLAEALGVDGFGGEDDDHGAAADFAVVIDLGGHFVGRGHGDFEAFEAGWAGDFRELHDGKIAGADGGGKTESFCVVFLK